MSISKERMEVLLDFQKKYDFNFSNPELLNQAFCHTSYTRENNLEVSKSYEKLEFYGDAVLKLVVSDIVYNYFTNYAEGILTKLRAEVISDRNIFRYALSLGFDKLILLGDNERKQGGQKKESILACAFEALLGAIFIEYKDEGYKKAFSFIKDNFFDDIISIEKELNKLNPKAALQEYTQSVNHKLPKYNVVREEGKEHEKTFFVEVEFEGEVIGAGSAKSIKVSKADNKRLVRSSLRNNKDES
mgnify:CR=1 FL=1